MLIWLLHLIQPQAPFLDMSHALIVRAIMVALSAFLISLLLGPKTIRCLQALQIGQAVRDDGPQSHLEKTGTPTMGGILILFSILCSVVLWGDLTNRLVWLSMLTMVGFGMIGFADDYLKVAYANSKGLPARWKYLLQSILALSIAGVLYTGAVSPADTTLVIPFVKAVLPQLGIFYVVLAYFVIVGTSNAVNLTDGLDGLAILPTVLVAFALGVFAYVTGHAVYAHDLMIPFVPHAAEMLVVCAAIAGSGLGFLWYNTYPAQLFMGDVGSLGLGALLGCIAITVRQEIILIVMGGIFVAETVSVILQVASFKLTGKRIFRMAPLHHHFELKGWPEPKVIVRFWIVTMVLVLIGLSSLKLR